MVFADTVLDGIGLALEQGLPDDVTVATIELNGSGAHKNVSLPIAEVSVESINKRERNTDRHGTVENDAGEDIGRFYTSAFTMSLRLELLTAEQASRSSRELARETERAFRRYDAQEMGQPIPHPREDGLLSEVTHVRLLDRQPNNDFNLSPALRSEQFDLEVRFTHTYSTVDVVGEFDPIRSVDSDVEPTTD